ncbi:SDR family NAD(P)-dependent oxidoreductase [Chitinophaga sp. Hz27]|uniref:SDR family NAD(P)-dependent oxidoreductase n=1 Tax=Chitinophaga sp. Hz27 TaxID=3347169 RepID=UPI0035E2D5BC
MSSTRKYDGLEIAVIGISARFQESRNYREFWQHLKDGKELIRTFTDDELRAVGVPEKLLRDKQYVKSVGQVTDKDCFDAGFFGYSAQEAACMDPQIRIFHEHCWEALEDSGYAAHTEKLKVGLFAGASVNDNWKLHAYSQAATGGVDPFYLSMIATHSFLPTLIAYKLNLRGPAVFVDTACSTSLTAVQLACRSLITRDCSLALAGGVSLKSVKGKGYLYREGMVASADGHCRTFDAAATGTASGEGAGVVLLKRLADAIRDRDHIYAVIRSAAINNDGNLKVGYTAPSVKGQADCIRLAHKMAGIDPRTVTYIEAHGTATRLGDPVEVRALNEAFGVGGADKYCAIGSVKSNVGHLDAAAGITGLIKTALSLKHRQLPASLHFQQPNPEIDFDGGPFYVNTSLAPWISKNGEPLRAGLSSLGIGGTNAHIILEEAPLPANTATGRSLQLLTISAKTPQAISRYADQLQQFLRTSDAINPADIAYTLQTGRKHFTYRKTFVYQDQQDLLQALDTTTLSARKSNEHSKLVFLFPGVGSQYASMGAQLYETEPVFRTVMDKGFELMQQMTGEDYRSIFYPDSATDKRINQMLHTQPAIFLFDYALATLLLSMGITPDYMFGHSVGEYVAACISGVFSFEDALKLVVARGQLMHSQPEGAMLSVPLSEADAQAYLHPELSLAAINGAEQVVFAGSVDSITTLAATLQQAGIPSVNLHSAVACHSYMMDPILGDFRTVLKTVQFNAPQQPYISCLSGQFIKAEECTDIEYWVRHLRDAVRFFDGMHHLLAKHNSWIFAEVGGGNALTSLLKQYKANGDITAINMGRHPKENIPDHAFLISRIGQLWELGVNPDWQRWYAGEERHRVSLPTYAFEPQKFPAEVDPFEKGFGTAGLDVPGRELKDWIAYPSWKRAVNKGLQQVASGRTYLVFSPDAEVFSLLTNRLKEQGNTIVQVISGDQYLPTSQHAYTLDPTQPVHFRRLFDALREDGVWPTDIIYAWGLAEEEAYKLEEGNLAINLAYLALARVVQEATQQANKPGRIWLLTQELHNVLGTEQGSCLPSLLIGLARVIPQETGISCCHIDITKNDYLPALLQEISREAFPEHHTVALRQGQRWVPAFQQHGAPLEVDGSTIRKEGIYLVTGGLGKVGYALAKHLVDSCEAKLVLTGRSALHTYPAEVQERWQYLKDRSKDIIYIQADVADLAAMEQLAVTVEESLGRIHGVIHTAGITDDRYFELIENMTPANTWKMLAPKMKGVENIYSVFRSKQLDFVWLASSVSVALGGLGYASYTAANAFMNHFVTLHAAELPHWRCISLGSLSFNEDASAQMGAAELVELFEWSLAGNTSQLLFQHTGSLEESLRPAAATIAATEEDHGPSEKMEKLERPSLSTTYIAPGTPTETLLKRIYEDFLGIADIGMEDHFFELGGDSLKGMMLLKKIRQEIQVDLPLREFLQNTNIRLIAARLDALRADGVATETSIVHIADKDTYLLSSSQFRLWMLSQVPESSIAYNMSDVYMFGETLDPAALDYAFHALIARHESLRTVFHENAQGEVFQVVLPADASGFQILRRDLRGEQDGELLIQQLVHESVTQPFDLTKGPLLRAGLYKVADDKWVFIYVMHHIVSDGWSMGIVMKELMQLYNAYAQGMANPLPPLRIQYRDYAAWQRARLDSAAMQQHKAYWLQQFSGHLPKLELPFANARPFTKTFRGDVVGKVIPATLSKAFRQLLQQHDATLFMGLLAAVNILLHKYSGQEDIITGTPIAGREHPDLDNQVGLYLNTLALRTRLQPEASFVAVMEHVRQITLGAYEHQAFPFDQLIGELQLVRDTSRNPLFDMMLILQNTQMGQSAPANDSEEQLSIANYSGRRIMASKFDLTFDFFVPGDEMHLSLVFNSDIYPKPAIIQLTTHLEQLMEAIVKHPDTPIQELDHLNVEEKAALSALESVFNAPVSEDF